MSHLHMHTLLSEFQSAYRPHHSTETALVRVVNDLLSAMHNGKVSILTLIDLSTAFITIDHDILLHRLQHVFSIQGTVLLGLKSYLTDTQQIVSVNGRQSKSFQLLYGVPQGSVLGPILFIMYTQPLTHVIKRHSLHHQLYADDTQLYKSCCPSEIQSTIKDIEDCATDIKSWMKCNKLQMNDDKTEAMLISSNRLSKFHPMPCSIQINDNSIQFSQHLRNLGILIDSSLSFHQQVNNICRAAYLELRRISMIRGYLSVDATKTLVCSLVLSRLDYCNAVLCGLPQCLLYKLQKVQNTAARMIFKAPRTDHITPILHKLHWLPVCDRIVYKISTLCHTSLTVLSPHYLSDIITLYAPSRGLCSSSDTRLLSIHRPITKSYGQRTFAY